MAKTADVIIIGAGIMGVSTTYHLARRKYGKVVVLEKDTVCSGSTGLANGGIRQQFSTRIGIELTRLSMPTFEHFKEEFGADLVYHRCGYLLLAQTEEELALFQRNVALQRGLGVEVHLLGPDEIRELFPYLSTEDLLAASYSPGDGYADPYLCTTAMAARVGELGAVIRQQHEVVAFRRSGGRVTGVATKRTSSRWRCSRPTRWCWGARREVPSRA